MNEKPKLLLNGQAIIESANDLACAVMGLPASQLVNRPLLELIQPEQRVRFQAELAEIQINGQRTGRLTATVVGVDRAARLMTLEVSIDQLGKIVVTITPEIIRNNDPQGRTTTIADARRLLPVSQRIAAICRRATQKKEILAESMAILSEITQAVCAAAIEWGGSIADWPLASTTGPFDKKILKGVFRSSVIARLARGDVIVKDAQQDGTGASESLILVPLMASTTPEGVILLYIHGYAVLSPGEIQGLELLGEIVGLGLRALSASESGTDDYQSRAADVEATIALGRLSAGLAHEINNAATVLRNNAEQISRQAHQYGSDLLSNSVLKDSVRAVEIIRDLTDALRAFAPEETREPAGVDLLRVIDTVMASVRFYAKQGLTVSVNKPDNERIWVVCRSHYLLRSLFLIFVELVESTRTSGRLLSIAINLVKKEGVMNFSLAVATGPTNVPTVLLSQLEKDGVLARLVTRAGASLAYQVQNQNLQITIGLPLQPDKSLSDHRTIIQPSTQIKPPGRRGTILIVDDEPAIIRSTRRVLEQHHDVLAAETGEEALQIIAGNPRIDILLLDIYMPGKSGLDVAEQLRKLHSPLAERIIFITGGTANPALSRFVAETKAPILDKPLDLPLLNTLISDMISIYS